MKNFKSISALLIGATLLVGCSNNAPVSKTVSTSCATELDGMKVAFTITAPSEDAEIDSMTCEFEMPYSTIRDLSGVAGAELTDEDVKLAVKQNESVYKEAIGSMLNVEADSIKSEMTEESLNDSKTQLKVLESAEDKSDECKKTIAALKKSVKYMERTNDELKKLIAKEEKKSD